MKLEKYDSSFFVACQAYLDIYFFAGVQNMFTEVYSMQMHLDFLWTVSSLHNQERDSVLHLTAYSLFVIVN